MLYQIYKPHFQGQCSLLFLNPQLNHFFNWLGRLNGFIWQLFLSSTLFSQFLLQTNWNLSSTFWKSLSFFLWFLRFQEPGGRIGNLLLSLVPIKTELHAPKIVAANNRWPSMFVGRLKEKVSDCFFCLKSDVFYVLVFTRSTGASLWFCFKITNQKSPNNSKSFTSFRFKIFFGFFVTRCFATFLCGRAILVLVSLGFFCENLCNLEFGTFAFGFFRSFPWNIF